MSTFGKKALLNWDYNSDDKKRYLKTNKNIQLEILKKWYPIGETFYTKNSTEGYIITEYEEYMGFYLIKGYDITRKCNWPGTNPLNMSEPKWVERDRNIEKLFK